MAAREMIADALAFAAKHFPDAKSVKVKMKSGASMNIDLPEPTFADAHGGLNESELLVLSHLPESDKPGVTVVWLLNRTGYKDKSYLYKVLRRLRHKGAIEQDEAKGYRRSEKVA